MSMLYSWATPEYMLDRMSLDQIVYYYNIGWVSKKTEATVYWGILGEALSDDGKTKKTVSIDEFRKQYPDGKQTENGYIVTR